MPGSRIATHDIFDKMPLPKRQALSIVHLLFQNDLNWPDFPLFLMPSHGNVKPRLTATHDTIDNYSLEGWCVHTPLDV